MKKTLIICLSLCLSFGAFAQNNAASITLFPFVEDWAEPFPSTAKAYVINKLTNLCSSQGIASTDYLSQFLITVRATPLSKDILAGPPMQVVENIELTFYIADNINQKVFSSTSVNLKGVGNSEAKAYMDPETVADPVSYPSDDVLKNGSSFAYLPEEITRYVESLFMEVRNS